MSNHSLTQFELKQLLSYNPETGVFTRKVKTTNSVKVGDVAGTPMLNGYHHVSVKGRNYLAHGLAWLCVYGHWPSDEIDHINGIRNDNQLSNLREATRLENCRNTCRPRDNTSGTVGVSFSKRRNNWRAYIAGKGIGEFAKKEEAIAARKAAELEYGFHPNHGREK